MRWLADLVYLLVGLLYLPVALYNALILGKNRTGWKQRFGGVPDFESGRTRIWIHAVSLGEMNATSTLVAALRERLPDADIVLSSTTDTGFAQGVKLYGTERVFRFPLDFSLVIARSLRRIRPSLIVLMELEVWPNLVTTASKRGIPVAIANGRLTRRSAWRLRCLGPICTAMFRPLAWVGAQDEEVFSGFRELGVLPDRIAITSSLKWDTALVSDSIPGADVLARACGLNTARSIWVCGSTGPGEEEIILDAYTQLTEKFKVQSPNFEKSTTDSLRASVPPCLRDSPPSNFELRTSARELQSIPQLVIVPRKPERFAEVAALIERRGLRCVRRTASPDGTERVPLTPGDVVLGDTMGELRKFYSLCSVALVGRSLVPMGGSDTMEVAALGKPMIVGPHNENFREAFAAFRSAGVLTVVDSADSLANAVIHGLADTEQLRSKSDAAKRTVRNLQGATAKTADALLALIRCATAGTRKRRGPDGVSLNTLDPAGVIVNSRGLSPDPIGTKPPDNRPTQVRP